MRISTEYGPAVSGIRVRGDQRYDLYSRAGQRMLTTDTLWAQHAVTEGVRITLTPRAFDALPCSCTTWGRLISRTPACYEP